MLLLIKLEKINQPIQLSILNCGKEYDWGDVKKGLEKSQTCREWISKPRVKIEAKNTRKEQKQKAKKDWE